jgi:CHAT domain-containing protein
MSSNLTIFAGTWTPLRSKRTGLYSLLVLFFSSTGYVHSWDRWSSADVLDAMSRLPKPFPLVRCLVAAIISLPLLIEWKPSASWSSQSSVCDELRGYLGAFRTNGGGRLSCDFEYSPTSVPPRFPGLGGLIGRLDQVKAREPLPQQKADQALIELVQSHSDQAVEALVKAHALMPEHTEFASDLAAALFARYETKKDPYDLVRALTVSSQAIDMEPRSRAPRFNFALALDKLFLSVQAERAWLDYLNLDATSRWADEARSHLSALRAISLTQSWSQVRESLKASAERGESLAVRRLLAPFHEQARALLEEEILPDWADAYLGKKDPQKSAHLLLAMAHIIGEALKKDGGDPSAFDLILSIEANGDHRRDIADGCRAFREGISHYEKHEDDKAVESFTRSHASFDLGDSPFKNWALVRLGMALNYLGKPEEAYVKLSTLLKLGDLAQYRALLGRAHIVLGIATGKLGRYSESVAHYGAARDLFAAIYEKQNTASSHYMLGEILQVQGEQTEAWAQRYLALSLIREVGSTIYRHLTLLDASSASLQQGFPQASLIFQAEMLSDDLATGDPLRIVDTLLTRTRTQLGMNDLTAALSSLSEADGWLAKVPPTSRRIQLEADVLSTRGEIELKSSPLQAVSFFDKAISIYGSRGDAFRLPELYANRAQARIALGDYITAEADLQHSLDELQVQRNSIVDAALREAYLDQAKPIYDAMIRLQAVDMLSASSAFGYAERARSQNLLEEIVPAARGSLGGDVTNAANAVAKVLPSDSAVIEFTVLDDEVLVWTVTNHGLDQIILKVDRQRLAGLSERYVHAIEKRNSIDAGKISRSLYDCLLAPLGQNLAGIANLVIVADKFLHRLPFESLRDPKTNRYLVEDFSVSYAPSCAVLLAALDKQEQLSGDRVENFLVVGNPLIDRDRFPDLANLPSSGVEANSLASLYGNSKVLVGADASDREFLAQAPNYSVVHVAAHALVNQNPLLSGLVLARSRGSLENEYGMVKVKAINKLHFSRTKLVVLAGCETATGGVSNTEGVESLVTPFLAAGVPSVVASRWQVGDEVAEIMLLNFHRYRKEGLSNGNALRKVQLEMLHSSDPAQNAVVAWAGFEAIGAI